MEIPELLIPAGNMSKLQTALAYGADAVYVGAAGFSMRPDEASFYPVEMAEAVDFVHSKNRKLYAAINTLMFQEDISSLRGWVESTGDVEFDAVIVSDAGVFSLIREMRPELKLHISTQASTSNSLSATFWKNAGASRVILSRECTLAHAGEISRKSGIETEIFIHGAMCVAVSGRCLLSAHLCGQSGSKGRCKHSCRWEWQLVEQKRPGEPLTAFEAGGQTIFLGSKDLCLIEHIPELTESAVSSLKVEGRMKSEYYIATVTRVYRAALDKYAADPDAYQVDERWIRELEAVSHRPHSKGFAFGYPVEQPDSLQAQSSVTSTHDFVGAVERVSNGAHMISVKNPFSVGEEIEWIGPAMDGGTVTVEEIFDLENASLNKSHCGTTVTLRFKDKGLLPQYAILRRRRKLSAEKTGGSNPVLAEPAGQLSGAPPD